MTTENLDKTPERLSPTNLEEPNTECVWCSQHMTPDTQGDWITCPNAHDVCIDCCPCCGTQHAD